MNLNWFGEHSHTLNPKFLLEHIFKSQKKMIKGKRLRPRVGIVGNFSQSEIERFLEIFPTIWVAKDYLDLSNKINFKEIDLLVVGDNFRELPKWYNQIHVICFCYELPNGFIGPNGCWIRSIGPSTTEEFELPPLSLSLDRLRKTNLQDVKNFKCQQLITIEFHSSEAIQKMEASLQILKSNVLFSDPHSDCIYSFFYFSNDTNKGLAWLPTSFLNKTEWCYAITKEWAKIDEDSFESFQNWEDDKEWMSLSELELVNKIESLEERKTEYIRAIDQEIADLNSKYTNEKISTNNFIRKLLTTQGEELVEIVSDSFSEIGFKVQKIDEQLEENQPKREDIRLSISKWEAIVEIRGYDKSSGKTADLQRLNRFSELYFKENNRFPDKKIYVVNGQIELPPASRQLPLESSTEDIQIFAENNGLIISTIELFKVIKKLNNLDSQIIINSIINATGPWSYSN